jgi:hypothetical protein
MPPGAADWIVAGDVARAKGMVNVFSRPDELLTAFGDAPESP